MKENLAKYSYQKLMSDWSVLSNANCMNSMHTLGHFTPLQIISSTSFVNFSTIISFLLSVEYYYNRIYNM